MLEDHSATLIELRRELKRRQEEHDELRSQSEQKEEALLNTVSDAKRHRWAEMADSLALSNAACLAGVRRRLTS